MSQETREMTPSMGNTLPLEVDDGANDKPYLATLQGTRTQVPDADYQDFRDIRGVFTESHGDRND